MTPVAANGDCVWKWRGRLAAGAQPAAALRRDDDGDGLLLLVREGDDPWFEPPVRER